VEEKMVDGSTRLLRPWLEWSMHFSNSFSDDMSGLLSYRGLGENCDK